MPTFSEQTFSSYFKRILQISQTSNTGVDATTRAVETGDGVATSISLSDDVLQVKPQNDDTTGAFLVKNKAGNNILAVDTDNSKVLIGASQVSSNTQYAYFNNDNASAALYAADTWYGINFNSALGGTSTSLPLGSSTSSSFNDTDPAATPAIIASTANLAIRSIWYVLDNITIDAVHWFHAASTATGDTTAAHLMSYDIDTDNGATGGDISGGVVVADGSNITNAGYEQIHYQSMTVQSADVNAGKAIIFAFASDTVNSDYSINAIVKYHIR